MSSRQGLADVRIFVWFGGRGKEEMPDWLGGSVVTEIRRRLLEGGGGAYARRDGERGAQGLGGYCPGGGG